MIKDDLKEVITGLGKRFADELFSKEQAELEEYWHFKHDADATAEWNLYQFTSMLALYKSFCSRWEEHHNGHCCVVERVRDTYLMPKIRAYLTHQPLAEQGKEPNNA